MWWVEEEETISPRGIGWNAEGSALRMSPPEYRLPNQRCEVEYAEVVG
jgi:hypothetical protein